MQRYSTGVLILLLTVFSTGSESADIEKGKLQESATLTCSERCSGVVRWTEFSNSTEVLAECDQTSCRSVKEGYQMIHDQYLKGDLSLTITPADLSKRGLYTCTCKDDDSEPCDVELQVEDGEGSVTCCYRAPPADEPEGQETNPSRRRRALSDCRPCGRENKKAAQSGSVTPGQGEEEVVEERPGVGVGVGVGVVAVVLAVAAVLFVKRQKRNGQQL